MNCFKCKEPLKTGAKFCNECGAKQQVSCPSCGKALLPGETVCAQCRSNSQPATPPQHMPLDYWSMGSEPPEVFSQTTQALPLLKELPPQQKGSLGTAEEDSTGLHRGSLGAGAQQQSGAFANGPQVVSMPPMEQATPSQAMPPVTQGVNHTPQLHNPMANAPTPEPQGQGANPVAPPGYEVPHGDSIQDACTEGDAKNRGFTFELIERGYRITRFNGRNAHPQVPAFIERVPVVELHREAFEAKGVASVVIPDTVTDISDWCFTDNTLSKLHLPESVKYVGLCAFKGNRINTINIPRSLKKVDEEAFECNKLTNINLPQMLDYIGKSAFSYNNLTNVVIPSSVTYIGKHAFSYNQLNSVIISPGVAFLGEHAFAYNQLNSISVPYGVTEISAGAFYMNKLTKVIIPSSVHSIGENAFRSNQLTTVGVPKSVLDIHPNAFDKWVEIIKI